MSSPFKYLTILLSVSGIAVLGYCLADSEPAASHSKAAAPVRAAGNAPSQIPAPPVLDVRSTIRDIANNDSLSQAEKSAQLMAVIANQGVLDPGATFQACREFLTGRLQRSCIFQLCSRTGDSVVMREQVLALPPGSVKSHALSGLIFSTPADGITSLMLWAMKNADPADVKSSLEHYGSKFQVSPPASIRAELEGLMKAAKGDPHAKVLTEPVTAEYGKALIRAAPQLKLESILDQLRWLEEPSSTIAMENAAAYIAAKDPLSLPALANHVDLTKPQNQHLISRYAAESPEAANDFAISSTDSAQVLLPITFSVWIGDDPLAATAWAAALDAPGIKSIAAEHIVKYLTENGDPEAAQRWAEQILPKDQNSNP